MTDGETEFPEFSNLNGGNLLLSGAPFQCVEKKSPSELRKNQRYRVGIRIFFLMTNIGLLLWVKVLRNMHCCEVIVSSAAESAIEQSLQSHLAGVGRCGKWLIYRSIESRQLYTVIY
jgi:hypothetical protein